MHSLTALYEQMREPIFRFLHHLTGDADLAEELTQETFLQAILSLPRFRGEASLSTWLFGIARNLYRKRMAQEQRRRRPPPLPDPSPCPLQEAEAREEQRLLARALASLAESYRTALVLREYEGLSYAEIGHLNGKTEVWARVTCFRGRQMLREAYLKAHGGDAL